LDFIGIPSDDSLAELDGGGELTDRDATVDFAATERNDFSHLPKTQQRLDGYLHGRTSKQQSQMPSKMLGAL
jgi:hypothetical protein